MMGASVCVNHNKYSISGMSIVPVDDVMKAVEQSIMVSVYWKSTTLCTNTHVINFL